jgi:hypothetical protein
MKPLPFNAFERLFAPLVNAERRPGRTRDEAKTPHQPSTLTVSGQA